MATTINATAANPCLKVQEDLAVFFGDAYPLKNSAPKGTVDALNSDINKGGITQEMIQNGDAPRPTSTSTREILTRYITQECTADLPTFDPCNLPTLRGATYKTAKFTVTRNTPWGFQLNEAQYRDMCEGKNRQYMDLLLANYAPAKRNMNQQAVALVKAAMGTYAQNGLNSVTTPDTINIISSDGILNPVALTLIKQYYRAMNISSDPIMVGAGKLSIAQDALRYAGLKSSGVDASGATIPNFFYDEDVNLNFGDGLDHLLTWMPSSIQFMGWNDFVGDYEIFEPQVRNGRQEWKTQQTTMLFDGILWDFVYEYDCGIHKFVWNKYFDIAPLPSDAFASCQDFNYALHFLMGCGDLTCDAINDASVAAASA